MSLGETFGDRFDAASDQTPDSLSVVLINVCKSRAIVISVYNLKSVWFKILSKEGSRT